MSSDLKKPSRRAGLQPVPGSAAAGAGAGSHASQAQASRWASHHAWLVQLLQAAQDPGCAKCMWLTASAVMHRRACTTRYHAAASCVINRLFITARRSSCILMHGFPFLVCPSTTCMPCCYVDLRL
jgi:hypothetical protein